MGTRTKEIDLQKKVKIHLSSLVILAYGIQIPDIVGWEFK